MTEVGAEAALVIELTHDDVARTRWASGPASAARMARRSESAKNTVSRLTGSVAATVRSFRTISPPILRKSNPS